jgi:predicted nucleic acid-binding protein
MVIYCDTSALAKKYLEETGRQRVEELLKQTEYLITSALTKLELISLLERAKREGRLDSPSYRQTTTHVERDMTHGEISFLMIDEDVINLSKRLIRQRKLRVQDSIQLATALQASKGADDDYSFMSSDRVLLDAARLEGLKCVDPTA